MKVDLLIARNTFLWKYLDSHLQGLIEDGEILLADVLLHEKIITDYSYLVFPFSKAYEGFLKRLFLDLDLIEKAEFYGDDIRIGRILNPTFRAEKKSVYGKVIRHIEDTDLSENLWTVWKNARNLVFHYYPHNFRKLEYKEAESLINDIIVAMKEAVELLNDSK